MLMKPVLVAYATNYGSTREVAEAVSVALAEHGVYAIVRAARDVDMLNEASAVVLGGALYFFRLHKDARRFLSRHRKALTDMPVAVFGMGPFKDTKEDFAGACKQLDRALSQQAWLSPVSVQVFGGCFDPTKLRFPHNNPGMKRMPASDIRNTASSTRTERAGGREIGRRRPIQDLLPLQD